MPLYTTDALILRTYKLGESDRIVVFLTRDRGKKRGGAKNERQSRRRFGGARGQPVCVGARGGDRRNASRDRGGAPGADCDAPGEGSQVGARVKRNAAVMGRSKDLHYTCGSCDLWL